jgi:hypothetical protein
MIPQPKIDIAQLTARLERQILEGETPPATQSGVSWRQASGCAF